MSDVALRKEVGAKGKLKAQDYGWELIAQKVLGYYERVLSESPVRK